MSSVVDGALPLSVTLDLTQLQLDQGDRKGSAAAAVDPV